MTRVRISTLIRALQLHQLSQTVEPVVMSFSLFETISFMQFEVAKANILQEINAYDAAKKILSVFHVFFVFLN